MLAIVSIVLGGLVAAVTGPLQWPRGSWVAAYLVLVTGVAQAGLGMGALLLGRRPPSRTSALVELFAWNVGSALVIAGQLLDSVVALAVGSGLLVVALVLWERDVRGSGAGAWVWGYRALAFLLLVSIPVGVTLSIVRG